MRLPARAFFLGLAALVVSNLVAVYAESQAAAQTSWFLVFAVVLLAGAVAVDAAIRYGRRLLE